MRSRKDLNLSAEQFSVIVIALPFIALFVFGGLADDPLVPAPTVKEKMIVEDSRVAGWHSGQLQWQARVNSIQKEGESLATIVDIEEGHFFRKQAAPVRFIASTAHHNILSGDVDFPEGITFMMDTMTLTVGQAVWNAKNHELKGSDVRIMRENGDAITARKFVFYPDSQQVFWFGDLIYQVNSDPADAITISAPQGAYRNEASNAAAVTNNTFRMKEARLSMKAGDMTAGSFYYQSDGDGALTFAEGVLFVETGGAEVYSDTAVYDGTLRQISFEENVKACQVNKRWIRSEKMVYDIERGTSEFQYNVHTGQD
ncbi:hypothetical protein [Acetonema longum]|uniref:Uncharacterized protein n=1 Tax=Acetonema longum DSM 6540 TaxID=1009370 RepID=F7NII1_9FIRM|nr:hypothetical protein [Acetonema longum]EGO64127.1 hypothetical protein ALO_09419 [Acetonema longum DSM 6540]